MPIHIPKTFLPVFSLLTFILNYSSHLPLILFTLVKAPYLALLTNSQFFFPLQNILWKSFCILSAFFYVNSFLISWLYSLQLFFPFYTHYIFLSPSLFAAIVSLNNCFFSLLHLIILLSNFFILFIRTTPHTSVVLKCFSAVQSSFGTLVLSIYFSLTLLWD